MCYHKSKTLYCGPSCWIRPSWFLFSILFVLFSLGCLSVTIALHATNKVDGPNNPVRIVLYILSIALVVVSVVCYLISYTFASGNASDELADWYVPIRDVTFGLPFQSYCCCLSQIDYEKLVSDPSKHDAGRYTEIVRERIAKDYAESTPNCCCSRGRNGRVADEEMAFADET